MSTATALAAGLLHGGAGPVTRRTTHCSEVLLTADRAYKLKRPVRFDFVDQRSPLSRRRACEREAQLNQLLAPGLIVGVRGVLRAGAGRCVLGAPDDPAAIDWAVEMMRFDEALTLSAVLATRAVDPAVAAAVGRRLATFHVQSAPWHGEPGVGTAVEENLDALIGLTEGGPLHQHVVGLRRFAASFLLARHELVEHREAIGLTVDGHGDLRAEHVLLDRTVPRFVDRLDIDALRRVDVADDLAFLLMDLEHLGAPELAAMVLRGYRDAAKFLVPDELLAFFGAHRAAVRAKVALLRADQGGAAQAEELLALGRRMAWRARGPLTLLVTGPPASGKSTLAGALAAVAGLPLVSSDGLRRAAGDAPARYDQASRRRVYDELGRRAAEQESVIVDATFGDPELQRAFARHRRPGPGRTVLALDCTVDAKVRDQRARRRATTGTDASEAGPAEAAMLAGRRVPIAPALVDAHQRLETSAPVGVLVETVEAWLDRRLSSPRTGGEPNA